MGGGPFDEVLELGEVEFFGVGVGNGEATVTDRDVGLGQVEFVGLDLVQPLLDGVKAIASVALEADNFDGAELAKAVDSGDGLLLNGRVPPGIGKDDVLSGVLQVEANATGRVGDEEEAERGVGVELGEQCGALGRRELTRVDLCGAKGREEGLEAVEEGAPLGEDDGLAIESGQDVEEGIDF